MAKKKTEKKRGSRTCGKGGIKKWRGKGHRGGRGFSGSKKHRKSWIIKNAPNHLGKRGFVPKTSKEINAINLKDLEKLIGDKEEVVLPELGFHKVLGTGKLKKKVVIKAYAFSERAKEKIEKIGGKALVIEQ
ncbi:MAG: uL15 family ribosomal protein [Candidatus Aenigmarchaeota archaeon]|nr:uL15 family ribosomal protein [Candidatus Aenigmarchaeota archaeon]